MSRFYVHGGKGQKPNKTKNKMRDEKSSEGLFVTIRPGYGGKEKRPKGRRTLWTKRPLETYPIKQTALNRTPYEKKRHREGPWVHLQGGRSPPYRKKRG